MATISVKLKPWTTPNYVVLDEDGVKDQRSIPIDQLDYPTLDAMCREFRAAVFARARVQDQLKTVR